MITIQHTVKDPIGMHARPAGMFVKLVKSLNSTITVTKGDALVNADRLLALMGLAIKCGDVITVTVTGGNEAGSEAEIRTFLEKYL